MIKVLRNTLLAATAWFLLMQQTATAQLSLSGQIRTRSELRHGQGSLPVPEAKASFFTNQRTRFNVGYHASRYRFFVSAQEVRVWGSDQSTVSNLEGSKLFLHQAWGEIILSDSANIKVDNLSIKTGRQEIVYDDARLLGNLDWLQQGRRHDAIVVKFSHKGWLADAGFAFNQNHGKDTPGRSGNVYNGIPAAPVVPGTNAIGMMYKSMQYGYFARTGTFGKLAALVFKDDFQKMQLIDGVNTAVPGVNSRITVGGALFSRLTDRIQLNAAAYYQGNNDRFGNTLDAHNFTADVAYTAGKFTTNPGFDYLSGNNTREQSRVNRRFDPLYGTPHKFWGFMDYFYVADQFGADGLQSRSPGLLNFFVRNRYRVSNKLMLTLDLHEFYAGNEIADRTVDPLGGAPSSRRLGTEIDFVVNYTLMKELNIEAGYATIFATPGMDLLKAPATYKQDRGQWAYLMLNFTPDFLAKSAKN
ncbi:alginate export family protein [Pontibacter beigongshangensis]|uniref:alginate export family protein n=1 Tax=Pontibacter beigongshangensis TaxID=2574733 RepID=UPI00164FEDBD|nr:alginate export family protein [Pontibacter beigongshangensis]